MTGSILLAGILGLAILGFGWKYVTTLIELYKGRK